MLSDRFLSSHQYSETHTICQCSSYEMLHNAFVCIASVSVFFWSLLRFSHSPYTHWFFSCGKASTTFCRGKHCSRWLPRTSGCWWTGVATWTCTPWSATRSSTTKAENQVSSRKRCFCFGVVWRLKLYYCAKKRVCGAIVNRCAFLFTQALRVTV